ncbi:hypothetical protein GDO78_017565 [Eleutherodactylus coqui]|uniref:Uncharacterized protein n=1 Tax=Eleutherodactylus coqui TaxID=57060 RepID=A0A8J6EJT6_ELECQ|nr:hypothetical protein GDO78_017565 [Eleutherodactylus coqui]
MDSNGMENIRERLLLVLPAGSTKCKKIPRCLQPKGRFHKTALLLKCWQLCPSSEYSRRGAKKLGIRCKPHTEGEMKEGKMMTCETNFTFSQQGTHFEAMCLFYTVGH